MKFNSPVRYALAVVASILIASCGGGGAKTNPNLGGTLSLLPTAATFYAGVVYTMTAGGGKPPYALTSSEPSLLPVPAILNGNQFQVVGNNPSTIDTGLPVGALPVKTVTLSIRDSAGQGPFTATIQVARNFLTSYAIFFTHTTCTTATGTTAATIVPCAGGDTTLEISSDVSGNLVGDAQFTLEVVSGTMGFVNPLGSNTVTQTYTTTSDHQGNILAVVRVPASTPTQIGVIRVTHVASGVSTIYNFTITGQTGGALTAIPSSFSFTGAQTNQCGTGSGDFFVTGGVPPYSAVSSDPNISVQTVDAQTGQFQVTAGNPGVCVSTATIVISDSGNTNPANRTTVTVSTNAGSGAPPPSALTVTPTTTPTGACGSATSVVVTGGTGAYQAASSSSQTTAVVAGNIVTITQNDPLADHTVTITDGSSNVTVSVPHC